MEKRQREQIVFDLVEGEHEIDGADDGRRGRGAPRRSTGGELLRDLGAALVSGMVRARGWVSRHRAVSLIATGVAAAVVFAAAGFGTVRDRERIELLRTAPGGVASLAGPPAEAWRYVPGGDTNLVSEHRFGTGSVTMGGNVVFLEGEQSGVNRSGLDAPDEHLRWREADLVAVDAHSGEEAWRVPLGADPECTPPEAGGATRALDEIVCLVGRADERSVVAVTADGEASEARRLDPTDRSRAERAEQVMPAWDGLVVRVRSEGDAPEIDCSEAGAWPQGCEIAGEVPHDRAIMVHAEDARTGDEVWREAVPWNGDLSGCLQYDDTGRPDHTPSLFVSGAVIQVWACGISMSVSADGTLLGGNTALLDGGAGDLILEQDFDAESNTSTMTVRTIDGEEILTTEGWTTEIGATDGTPSDTFIVRTGQGRNLEGYRLDGTQAWELENRAEGTVARVGHTGVFRRYDGGWMALDLRSGETLWEWSADEMDVHGIGMRSPAFTDGRTVMQVHFTDPQTAWDSDDQPDSGAHLVAVDAHSGRLRWDVAHEDTRWFAADGRLLSVSPDGSLVGHRG